MYGIETKVAKRAFKIGHVDVDKLTVGDFFQGFNPSTGSWFHGCVKEILKSHRFFKSDDGWGVSEDYEVEFFISKANLERVRPLLVCPECHEAPRYFDFGLFSNGEWYFNSSPHKEPCDAKPLSGMFSRTVASPELDALLNEVVVRGCIR